MDIKEYKKRTKKINDLTLLNTGLRICLASLLALMVVSAITNLDVVFIASVILGVPLLIYEIITRLHIRHLRRKD